jgi:hypothetical protein
MTTYDVSTSTGTVQIPTWSRATVVKVWAAVALPMAIMSWVVAPLLARSFSGPTALPRALVLSLLAGLVWQFALVLVVVRREQGNLRWPVVKAALWLNSPISPRTGRRDLRLWWVVVPMVVLLFLEEMLPALPTPVTRDLGLFLGSQLDLVRDSGDSVRVQHRTR